MVLEQGGELRELTLQPLPDDKIEWIERGRKATYARLLDEGSGALRFASYHLPVITTYSEGDLFPFNCANKGVGFLPKAEYLEEFIELFQDVHQRTRGRPWRESLRERVEACRRFYFDREKIDYRVLTTLEIFEKRTFSNIQRNPVAAVHYTGVSPEYVSFQTNCVVEVVPQGDPRHTFVMLVRTLFESEAFHIRQPQFPYAYLLWICDVRDKTPFRVPVQEEKVQYERVPGEIGWTSEARASVGRAPGMIQEFIKDVIETYARERGYEEIDLALVREAKEQFMDGKG